MATAVIMPRQGQSVESCILTAWLVKPGDSVKAGQPLASIETDKATFEVESPADGAVLELFCKAGDDVPVLANIAALGAAGEDVSSLRPGGNAVAATQPTSTERAEATPLGAPPVPLSTSPAAQSAAGSSPRARQKAATAGIDVSAVPGSGPGGRVIERDVIAAAASAPRLSAAARAATPAAGAVPAQGSGPGGLVLRADLGKGQPAPLAAASPAPATVPVTGIRKIIAERMRASLGETAQLTLTRAFNATAIQSYRAKIKARGAEYGLPEVTVNDLIAYATVRTLKKHPALNAHFLGDKIVQHAAVHLGIAVDTPRGLMVPVVRDASTLSIAALSAAVKPLAKSCQEGRVNPDNLQGGTFTITNLGALGIEAFTPVLNAPEVAILGVGGFKLQPYRTAQGVEFADFITLSLTIDHQAVDGAPAARFLKDLCDALENIELVLTSP